MINNPLSFRQASGTIFFSGLGNWFYRVPPLLSFFYALECLSELSKGQRCLFPFLCSLHPSRNDLIFSSVDHSQQLEIYVAERLSMAHNNYMHPLTSHYTKSSGYLKIYLDGQNPVNTEMNTWIWLPSLHILILEEWLRQACVWIIV